jgi:shikimate kinase
MKDRSSSIVLIGMPGAGKSTVGVLLAKLTCRSFVDTDGVIEEQVIIGQVCAGCVVATGGSAVYSPAAMAHLKRHGTIVFLDLDLAALEARVRNVATRGLAKRKDQSFADLFDERVPLYRRYADVTVDCRGLTHEEVCGRIIDELRLRGIKGVERTEACS